MPTTTKTKPKVTKAIKLKPFTQYTSMTMGCDPEFFFRQKGNIIGAEKVIPKGGIKDQSSKTIVIIDGVQAEINPNPNSCRQSLASSIANCFKVLAKEIKEKKLDVQIDFSSNVEIKPDDLKELSPESQAFGCSPSLNAYRKKSSIKIAKASEHTQRSAGGHVHMSLSKTSSYFDAKKLAMLLDILVGNTCVLLDRDPGNAIRRKHYGRAGEHRLPSHGFEYRTLSNFWLQSYPLMSFVFAMCRFTYGLMRFGSQLKGSPTNYVDALLNAVPRKDIEKAINTNNFALAYQNFLKIEPLLMQITSDKNYYNQHPLNPGNITAFKFLVLKGINHFFKGDIFEYWVKFNGGGSHSGWERFVDTTLKTSLKTETKEDKLRVEKATAEYTKEVAKHQDDYRKASDKVQKEYSENIKTSRDKLEKEKSVAEERAIKRINKKFAEMIASDHEPVFEPKKKTRRTIAHV